ncbi:hypothetical protein AAC387_Pa03g3364 [Persea americana]
MEGPSHKDFSVYDFNVGDEAVESASRELLMKYVNKGANVKQMEINDVFGGDFSGNNGDGNFNNCSTYTVGTSERDFVLQEETSGLDDIVMPASTNNDEHINTSQDKFHRGNLILGCVKMGCPDMGGYNVEALALRREQLDCALREVPSDEMISDDDGSMETSSLPNSVSDIEENEGAIEQPTPDLCCSGYEDMEKEKYLEVTVSPDYVWYGDRFTTSSQLTFTADCIKFEDLNMFGIKESFAIKWEIDDIIHIESQWSQTIQTCLVTLRLRPVDVLGVDNVCSTSGIEKFTCAVYDPHWRDKELKITSFASGFKDKWNTLLDGVREEDDFMGQHSMFFLKRYFTNFDDPFEDVVYPKEDPDAVSISKRDIELLQPETFVNDTIIDFYIKYLKNKIPPEDKHRFHFFNSFFFRKLADPDKDPGSALGGKAAFQRVRKWTRKVNIFEKDYIFVPVNYNLHWSLIVICHPGDIAYFKGKCLSDEVVSKAHKVPCILHMDSIKGSHNGLKNLIQSYLWEEWKVRHEEPSEDISLKFLSLRFVPLELPQQENSFDCGLFLLHYVELFLEQAPNNFSPFKITKLCNFLSKDWFPPAEASHKRSIIQKLIYELLDEQRQKIPKVSCNDQCYSDEDDIEKENAVEFLSEQCSPDKKAGLGDLLSSTDGGIERTVLPTSPAVQCVKEAGSVLQDFLEQGAIAGSSSDEGYRPCNLIVSHDSVLLPIEENAETGVQSVNSDGSDHQVPSVTTAEPCIASSSVEDAGAFEMSCSQEILIQSREDPNRDPSSESSSSMHLNTSEVQGNDHVPPLQNGDFVECNELEERDNQRSVSPEICGNVPNSPASGSTERLEELVVEDSQEGQEGDCQEVNAAVSESKESGDSFFSCQENLPASSCQDVESTETKIISVNGTSLSSTDLEDRSEQRVHKRLKLEPLEVERRRTRSSAARDSLS